MAIEVTDEMMAGWPAEAQAVVRLLLAEIGELKARLKQTPQNSSRPPSSQHPHAKPVPAKPKSSRQPGGQPGHAKHERALIPTEQCTAVVPLKPRACRRCGHQLAGIDVAPWRHQVWEVAEIKPFVTEYQRHRLHCAGCGITTCAALPAGVPHGQAGPRLIGLTALLMGCFRQSKRRVALFLEQVLNQPCSPGWVVKLQRQATTALRPAYEQLARQLPEQAVLGIDESPTKQQRDKAWLWTFVATGFTVFAVRTTRAATVLGELLTDRFGGIVMCDRARMYWSLGRLQWCWAHLKRDVQALIDSDDRQAKRLGRELLPLIQQLFRHWSRCRDGTITRRGLQQLMAPLRRDVEALLLRGEFSGYDRLHGFCRELHDHRDWLWTFVDHGGVEPTNNASERALRHPVIWRKLSFGTQSASGSRFVETMLTIIETCRQGRRNTFAFITQAVEAHFAGHPTPLLLTGP